MNKGKASDVAGAAAAAAELVSVGRPGGGAGMESTVGTSKCTDPLLRIAQLEQNIRFLQEQHQTMLAGLHQEIDSLRQRNRGTVVGGGAGEYVTGTSVHVCRSTVPAGIH